MGKLGFWRLGVLDLACKWEKLMLNVRLWWVEGLALGMVVINNGSSLGM